MKKPVKKALTKQSKRRKLATRIEKRAAENLKVQKRLLKKLGIKNMQADGPRNQYFYEGL